MKKLAVIIVALVATVPMLAFAQRANFENVFSATNTIRDLIRLLIPIIISAAVLMFLFGILKFVFATGEEGRKQAKDFMFLGVIALAVMVSVWGLVRFIQSTFGLENSSVTPPPAPGIPR